MVKKRQMSGCVPAHKPLQITFILRSHSDCKVIIIGGDEKIQSAIGILQIIYKKLLQKGDTTMLQGIGASQGFGIGKAVIMEDMNLDYAAVKYTDAETEKARFAKAVEDCAAELENKGLKFKRVPVGVMIETPAAALISDLLAKEVDFFSIGTNDLTGYIMATDRDNAKLGQCCQLKELNEVKNLLIYQNSDK